MSLVVAFPGASEASPESVGGKASSLIRMAAAGFRVPPGVVLTAELFAPWFAQVEASAAWKALLETTPERWPDRCADLKALLVALPWTADQRHALAELEASLPRGTAERFAVRSSAPDEDGRAESFAGAYLTRLGVSALGLEAAIRDCCASALDARVFAYRRACGLDLVLPRMAVVIQRQLASEVAGIGFSLNPLTNDYDEIVIDASWGLGEAVVSGRVTPDHWLVERVSSAVIERRAGAKEVEIELADDAAGVRENAARGSNAMCLSDLQVAEVATLVVAVEALFGQPVDVEWAWANGALHVLQARPITRYVPLPPELTTAPGEPRHLYIDAALSKGFTSNAPISTLALDVLERSMGAILEAWTGQKPAAGESLLLFAGARMYMDLSPLLWIVSPKMLAKGSTPTDLLMARILVAVDRKRYRLAKRPRWLGFELLWRIPRCLWGVRGLMWHLARTLIAPARAHRAYQETVSSLERALRELADENLSLDELQRRSASIFTGTVDILLAALVVGQLSPRLLVRRNSADDRALVDRLERGLPGNVVVDMGIRLHRLASQLEPSDLANLPMLASRIDRRQMPAPFLRDWDAFVERCGHRGPQEMDLASARYGDDPRLMLQQMAQLAGADTLDPGALHRRHVDERRTAYAVLLSRFGFLRRALLRRICRRQELFAGSRDTPKHLNLLSYHVLRRRALADGRRLVDAGRLDAVEHVFDLKIAEVVRAHVDPSLDLRHLSEARARFTAVLHAHVRAFPPVIDSRGRKLPPQQVEEGLDLLRGMPVSSGVASGPVKVLHRADEKPVERGDVLVAYTTDPGWTPLFVNAAAVVLEVGGVLQHGAVVAREFGKPCVVGIDQVRERLCDGDVVEVDGGAGTVRIVRRVGPGSSPGEARREG